MCLSLRPLLLRPGAGRQPAGPGERGVIAADLTMVQRSLDWRVLIATVVLGGALVGGVYALHEWQVARTAKGLQVLAETQEQKSQWRKAASYLDRYLRL